VRSLDVGTMLQTTLRTLLLGVALMCLPVAGARASAPGATCDRHVHDHTPPRLAGPPQGAWLQGAPGRGLVTIVVPARDRGSGLREAVASVDGAPAASAPAPSCPHEFAISLTVDTRALADGQHRLDVVVTDAAGNAATLVAKHVHVDNSVPAPAVPAPPPAPPAPPAQAPPAARSEPSPAPATPRIRIDRRRVRAGDGAITGRVVREGRPLAGARLAVERRWYGRRGGGWRRIGALTTDAAGRFALPAPRTAQELRLRPAGSRRGASASIDVVTQLRLRARLRPRSLRNGEVLTASARLLRAGRSALGKRVDIQAVVHGRWQTVGRASARANGIVRWRYRFRNTRREALYSFRVLVRPDPSRWPWPAVASDRIRVHVIP